MYIISLIIFLIVLLFTALLSGEPSIYIDFPSILIIVLVTGSMLVATGMTKDLFKGLKIVILNEKSSSKTDLICSLEAINLTSKLIIFSGLFAFLVGLIATLIKLDEPSTIGPNMAVSLLTILYSLFGTLFFIPIKSKIKVLINRFDE